MLYKIGALSWDKDFKDFLEGNLNNVEIKIHSIFNRVINLCLPDGYLYTISNRHTDNAPYTLKLDLDGSFEDTIKKEDKITIRKDCLIIGKLEINLTDLEVHKNEIKIINRFSVKEIKDKIEIFNTLIKTSGKDGGCKAFYLQHFLGINKNSQSMIDNEVTKRIQVFYEDLKENKLNENSIKKLVGLGVGLTPSGDDFLTGFLASAGIFECNKIIFDKISSLIYPILRSTTDVSATMLKAATEKKYREFLYNFVYSFFRYDEEEFIKAFKNILTIGSSSGTDMSIGTLIGFLYTLEKIERDK
jgi:hypothetical protein